MSVAVRDNTDQTITQAAKAQQASVMGHAFMFVGGFTWSLWL